MKTRAVSMVLLMIASALAGCTTGDPDGDGELGIDTDVLNQMIEDNLQDFINNTSVTVHQEIHYHNNTTYVDNSESNMNVGGGSGANGSLPGSIMQVYRIQDSAQYTTGDIGNNTFVLDGILQYPAIGISPNLIYTIGSTTISFTFTCNEFVNAYEHMNSGEWRDWLHYERGISWSDAGQIAEQIRDDFYQLTDESNTYCLTGESVHSQTFESEMLQMELSKGEALDFIHISGYWLWNISCDDGFFDSNSKYELEDDTPLLGGWEDCVFTIYQSFSGQMEWERDWSDNNDFPSWINLPDWHNYSGNDGWYYLNSESGTSEHDSIIYFTKYFVVPVE